MVIFRQALLINIVYEAIYIASILIVQTIGERISEIKCNEYTELVYPARRINLLLPPPFNSGQNAVCPKMFGKYIIGGRDATSGEYPYQVALGYDTQPEGIVWACGGAIISDEFILTAAHCIQTRYGPPRHVLMGDTKLSENKDSISRTIMNISETFVFPVYTAPVTYGDIALVKMASKLKFHTEIMPACLPDEQLGNSNFTWATVSSWGQFGEFDSQSDIMQTVNLTFWNITDCNTFFSDLSSKRSYPDGIVETQFCAGDPTGNKDTCHGDSGSPIVHKSPDECMYRIIGVTQGGKACGMSTPGVYTNVTSYLDWVEKIVWPNGESDPKRTITPEIQTENGTIRNTTVEVTADEIEKSNEIKSILGIPFRKPTIRRIAKYL